MRTLSVLTLQVRTLQVRTLQVRTLQVRTLQVRTLRCSEVVAPMLWVRTLWPDCPAQDLDRVSTTLWPQIGHRGLKSGRFEAAMTDLGTRHHRGTGGGRPKQREWPPRFGGSLQGVATGCLTETGLPRVN